MNRFFKIFLIVVLSVFSTLNLNANDTFFSIENKGSSVKELANAGTKSRLLNKFENYSVLKKWVNGITDAPTLSKLDDAFKQLDNNAIAQLNQALKKGDAVNDLINTEFAELLVKLSDGNTTMLSKIAGTGWASKTKKLATDLTNAPPAFKNKILNNTELIEAWEIVRRNIDNFGANTTKFALDADVLDKVYDLMKGGSNFRTKMTQYGLNWETELSTILAKNKSLKCATCGGGFTTRPDMVNFLSDVEFFVSHYDINGIGNKFYRWIKRINVNETTMLGGEGLPILEEMYQTLYHIRKKNITNVVSFGSTFPQGTKQFDLFFGAGKYAEFKNVNFTNITTLSNQMINQVIEGYFRNITSLDDFDWIAYYPKLKANGWATEAIALAKLKNLWKKAFNSRPTDFFDALWNNQALRTSLFGNRTQSAAQTYFNALKSNTDSVLFNFIKVE